MMPLNPSACRFRLCRKASMHPLTLYRLCGTGSSFLSMSEHVLEACNRKTSNTEYHIGRFHRSISSIGMTYYLGLMTLDLRRISNRSFPQIDTDTRTTYIFDTGDVTLVDCALLTFK